MNVVQGLDYTFTLIAFSITVLACSQRICHPHILISSLSCLNVALLYYLVLIPLCGAAWLALAPGGKCGLRGGPSLAASGGQSALSSPHQSVSPGRLPYCPLTWDQTSREKERMTAPKLNLTLQQGAHLNTTFTEKCCQWSQKWPRGWISLLDCTGLSGVSHRHRPPAN